MEIPKTATDDEVKKAYRKMAKKYHPDKVGHLGEEHQEAAEEKFFKVIDDKPRFPGCEGKGLSKKELYKCSEKNLYVCFNVQTNEFSSFIPDMEKLAYDFFINFRKPSCALASWVRGLTEIDDEEEFEDDWE